MVGLDKENMASKSWISPTNTAKPLGSHLCTLRKSTNFGTIGVRSTTCLGTESFGMKTINTNGQPIAPRFGLVVWTRNSQPNHRVPRGTASMGNSPNLMIFPAAKKNKIAMILHKIARLRHPVASGFALPRLCGRLTSAGYLEVTKNAEIFQGSQNLRPK